MNRQLLDPFQSVQLPDVIEDTLSHGIARSVGFNHRGTILAAGCEDGQIVLWDLETHGVARTLEGHKQAVTGLAWSRDGRRLVSGSLDGTVVAWDVAEGRKAGEVQLGSMVSGVSCDQTAAILCIASHVGSPPHLISLRDGSSSQLPSVITESDGKSASASGGAATSAAVTSADGSTVIVGQGRGVLVVFDAASLQIVDVIKLRGTPKVLGLSLNRKGDRLLALCNDRTVRLLEVVPAARQQQQWQESGQQQRQEGQQQEGHQLVSVEAAREALFAAKGVKEGSVLDGRESPALQSLKDFQNSVERTSWRAAAFTHDSEHVIGAAGGSSRESSMSGHTCYIWSAFTGQLEKVLESRNQPAAVALASHPQRHILAAVTADGQIYIWSKEYQENWSAFAPDFKELEANEEYVEQEDEFDVNERPGSPEADGDNTSEDTDVDIEAPEDGVGFSSDEEAGDALHHLPVVIRPQTPRPQTPPAAPKPVKEETPASSGQPGSRDGGGSGDSSPEQAQSDGSKKRDLMKVEEEREESELSKRQRHLH